MVVSVNEDEDGRRLENGRQPHQAVGSFEDSADATALPLQLDQSREQLLAELGIEPRALLKGPSRLRAAERLDHAGVSGVRCLALDTTRPCASRPSKKLISAVKSMLCCAIARIRLGIAHLARPSLARRPARILRPENVAQHVDRAD